MKTSYAKLAVFDGDRHLARTVYVDPSHPGRPVHLRVPRRARLLLTDEDTGFAPEHVSARRVGDDLQIGFDPADPAKPSLVIDDYYRDDADLVGQAEDGNTYRYVAADGEHSHDVGLLHDGTQAEQALGGDRLAATPLAAAAAEAATGTGWGIGALGMLGVSAAGIGYLVLSDRPGDNASHAAKATEDEVAEPPTITGVRDASHPAGTLADGGYSRDPGLTLVGTAMPGAVLIVTDNGIVIGSTRADAGGNWSFQPGGAAGLPDGEHVFLVGHSTPSGATLTSSAYTTHVDTVPPAAPQIGEVSDDAGPLTGALQPGAVTDDTRPVVTGTGAEPGGAVLLYVEQNGEETLLAQGQADADGRYMLVPAQPLAEGTQTLIVRTQDQAGNLSPASTGFTLTVDTRGPGVPEIDTIEPVDEGPGLLRRFAADDAPEWRTTETHPILRGRVEPNTCGSEVRLFHRFSGGEEEIGRGPLMPGCAFRIQAVKPLLVGQHEVFAVCYNEAGVRGDTGAVKLLHVDPLARPGNPAITSVIDRLPGDQTAAVGHDGVCNDNRPTVIGTALAGQQLKVYNGTTLIGEVTVTDHKGVWQFVPPVPLPDGEALLRVEVADAVPAQASEPHRFVVNTRLPEPARDIQLFDDAGAQHGEIPENGDTDDARPQVTGVATSGMLVHVLVDGKDMGSARADANGQWYVELNALLARGPHALTTTVTDAAGNVSPPSEARHFTVNGDARLEIARVLDDQAPRTGEVEAAGKTNDATPLVEGQAPAGARVFVYDGTTLLGSATASAEGGWQFALPADRPLTEGMHTLIAQAVDASGEAIGVSGAFRLGVDTTPPAPVLVEVRDGAGARRGPVQENDIIDDPQPVLRGTGEPGNDVALVDGAGRVLARGTVRADGGWTLSPQAPLPDRTHSLSIVETDHAGNTGRTSPFKLTTDTSAPVPPTIDRLIDDQGAAQGEIAPGAQLDDTRPELQGSGRAGDTIEIRDGARLLGVTTVGGDGRWRYVPDTDLAMGEHALAVTAINPAGNPASSAPFGFTLAPDAPAAPGARARIDAMSKDTGDAEGDFETVNGDAGRLVSGRLDRALAADEKLMVSIGGGQAVAALVVGDRWFVVDANAHTAGWRIEAQVVNAAGGTGPVSGRDAVLHAPPRAPQIRAIDELRDGVYTADEATAGATVRLALDGSGAKAGDVVHLIWGNTTHDHRLTPEEAGASEVAVRLPTEVTQTQGAAAVFDVSARLLSAEGGASAPSNLVAVTVAGGSSEPTTSGGKSLVVESDVARGLSFTPDAFNTSVRTPAGHDLVFQGLKQPASQATRVVDGDIRLNGWRQGIGDDSKGGSAMTLNINRQTWVEETMPRSIRFEFELRPHEGGPGQEQKLWFSIAYAHGLGDGQGALTRYHRFEFRADAEGQWRLANPSDPKAPSDYLVAAQVPDASNGYRGIVEVWYESAIDARVQNAVVRNTSSWDLVIDRVDLQRGPIGIAPTPPAVSTRDDTLDHVWEDLIGSDGQDMLCIAVDPTAYLKQKSARILGGAGIDTLVFAGEHQTLDLAVLRAGEHGRIDSIERFDLRGHGAGRLHVSADDVAHLGRTDAFHANGRTQLRVEGDASDGVLLAGLHGLDTGGGRWIPAGTILLADPDTGEPAVYVAYQFSTLPLEILVHEGVPVAGPGEDLPPNDAPEPAPDARLSIDAISKDTGDNDNDFVTANGAPGGLIRGGIDRALLPGERVMVSVDGGRHHGEALVAGRCWFFVDAAAHPVDWQIDARVVGPTGEPGTSARQTVHLDAARAAPVVTRVDELADGVYSADEARQGATVRVGIGRTGAKAGDVVHLVWGNTTHDHRLSAAEIAAGAAVVKIGPEATQFQGASRPFTLEAQIVSIDGASSPRSAPLTIGVAATRASGVPGDDPNDPAAAMLVERDMLHDVNLASKPQYAPDHWAATTSDNHCHLIRTRYGFVPSYCDGTAIVDGMATLSAVQAGQPRRATLCSQLDVMPDTRHTPAYDDMRSARIELVQTRNPNGRTDTGYAAPPELTIYARWLTKDPAITVNKGPTAYLRLKIGADGVWEIIQSTLGFKVVPPSADNGGGGTIEFAMNRPDLRLIEFDIKNYTGWDIGIQRIDLQKGSTVGLGRPPLGPQAEDGIDAMWESHAGIDVDEHIRIAVDPTAYLRQSGAKILGAGGIDTLVFTGDKQMLDLTALQAGERGRIDAIERFDLRGHGAGAIKLSADDVARLGSTDAFHKNGRTQLMIEGDAEDTVTIGGLACSAATGGWIKRGVVSLADPDGGARVDYQSYQYADLPLEVLVRQDMRVSGEIGVITPAKPVRRLAPVLAGADDEAPALPQAGAAHDGWKPDFAALARAAGTADGKASGALAGAAGGEAGEAAASPVPAWRADGIFTRAAEDLSPWLGDGPATAWSVPSRPVPVLGWSTPMPAAGVLPEDRAAPMLV